MSGTSSDYALAAAAAVGVGITDDSIPGTKRNYEPSSPDHSGCMFYGSASNKRPRLVCDHDDCYWMGDGWVLEEAYDMLISDEVISRMVRGSGRVERLLCKAAQLKLDANIILLLEQQLLPSFKDLLTSVEILGTDNDNYPEMLRLVNLAKRILQLWQIVENEIPLPDVSYPSSCLYMAPIGYPHPVPSAWLFEYRWHDKAYEEVLSIRKKYSYLLDEAYRYSYTSYLGKHGNSGSMSLSRKKLLNFLVTSREDFEFLDVEKCYKRVMSIKKLCTFKVLGSPCASEKLTHQTELPNWRDDIYDQVAVCRKMYSLDLDKLLRDEVDKMQSATPDEANKERRSFLEESLQFLANSRADIAILKEEYCRKQLAVIKHRMEDTEDFLASKQPAPPLPGQTGIAKLPTNWLDLEYVALRNKALRFTYEVYDVYLKHQPVWSKIPACNEDLKKLECHMDRALKFYKMRRGEMSLLFVSKDDYYDTCWGSLKEDVRECIRLIKLLIEKEGTKPGYDFCRYDILVPKLNKFASRLRMNNIAIPK